MNYNLFSNPKLLQPIGLTIGREETFSKAIYTSPYDTLSKHSRVNQSARISYSPFRKLILLLIRSFFPCGKSYIPNLDLWLREEISNSLSCNKNDIPNHQKIRSHPLIYHNSLLCRFHPTRTYNYSHTFVPPPL